MDSLPVTLIVKAPNQQIEDQRIRCETSWTINKLKQHLSEVYPSKPPHHEQKLIYSGQLLNDSVILKDVLRQYDDQDTHTVHLVCTPIFAKMGGGGNKTRQSTPVAETSSATTPSSSSSATIAPPQAPASQAQPSRVEDNNRVPPAFPENGYNWGEFNGQVPPMMNLNGLNQYQMQMAWMQQAYMQYMTQYMQIASGQIPPMHSGPHTLPAGTAPQGQPNQAEPAPGGAPPPNPPAAQPPQENEDRDWLDVFYVFSRALVLSTVIYFYSTPVRFFFVFSFAVALYLYKVGFFRNININNNNHILINGGATPEGEQPLQEDQAPTRFMVAWTFITTFFASLIPEIPNINA